MAEQGASSELRLALEKLVPHVLHYATMPRAHADASRDVADARRALANVAKDTRETSSENGLPSEPDAKVAQAGELMLRAAAVLGTLTQDQQESLHEITEGKLTDCLAWAINGAAVVSPAVAASLKSHGPRGFLALTNHKA